MKHIVSRKERDLALIQIFYLFVLPPALIYLNVIPESWRFFVLVVCCLIIFGIIKYENWKNEMLGLLPIKRSALWFYISFTFIGILALHFLSLNVNKSVPWQTGLNLLIFFLPISILQEFAFRGVLLPLSFQLLDSKIAVIILNVLLFTFIHIIYPPLSVSIPVAILSGIAFVLAYLKYPNLILISLSHAVLNFVAVGYGFFNIK